MKRLMEYKIISGRVVEIKRSYMSSTSAYRKPRGTRRAGSSSEAKIRANEKSTVRNLARLINCNFDTGDAQVVLKYDPEHYPPGFRYEDAAGCLKKFLTKLRRLYARATGKKLRAVWVTANWSPHRQAPARLHHHLVLPGDALELARQIWTGGGFSMELLDSRGDHTDLAAYMIENVHGRPAGENRWSSCRGMERPIMTEPEEVSDVEDVKPEYGSTIMDVEHTQDEDGRVTGSYLRCRLPERPKIRGGQILLPRKGMRKTG